MPTTAAEIVRGLLDMYAAVKSSARTTAFVNNVPFNVIRRWRSSPEHLRPLEISFNVENVFVFGLAGIDRASRMSDPEPPKPSYAAPFLFTLESGQGGELLRTQTTNCILRLLLIAGLALVAVLLDASIDHNVPIERLKAACREQVERREATPLAITVHLSTV